MDCIEYVSIANHNMEENHHSIINSLISIPLLSVFISLYIATINTPLAFVSVSVSVSLYHYLVKLPLVGVFFAPFFADFSPGSNSETSTSISNGEK